MVQTFQGKGYMFRATHLWVCTHIWVDSYGRKATWKTQRRKIASDSSSLLEKAEGKEKEES